MSTADNVRAVQARIEEAAKRTGRASKDVTLVAVAKGVTVDDIKAAQEAGVTVFAENRIQEAREKVPLIPAQWHLVGHLQSNKIKDAIELFSMVQSVDSVRLAGKINEAAALANKAVDVLLEINISGEEQKYGFSPEEIYRVAEELAPMTNLRVQGLMGIAPNTGDVSARRDSFKKLRNVFSVCKTMKRDNFQMKHLSMGMSDDFQIAIEEGSTMVRVGRALFGERKNGR